MNEIAAKLAAARHHDGGWGYSGRSARTEPTALAILALSASGLNETLPASTAWLLRRQRSDGGWAPDDNVSQSTWVTSIVLLTPGLPAEPHRRGLDWLLHVTNRDSWLVERIRAFLLGVQEEAGEGTTGWPFFPGTAGWVTPTSIAMLALRSAARRYPNDPRIKARTEAGRDFLLARQCPDGGWNHGNSRALGVDLTSYPETTGQALLALRGHRSASVDKALQCAERHLARAESVEATVWLRLGLLAHGHDVARQCPECRGTMDLSLRLILEAVQKGVNVFV